MLDRNWSQCVKTPLAFHAQRDLNLMEFSITDYVQDYGDHQQILKITDNDTEKLHLNNQSEEEIQAFSHKLDNNAGQVRLEIRFPPRVNR